MRDEGNIKELIAIRPDYIGFIFYAGSRRYVSQTFIMPEIPRSIKKVGVFVDESIDEIERLIHVYGLNAVQLHGAESVDYCRTLRSNNAELILLKAIGIADKADIEKTKKYEEVCDMLVLDTKGKEHGGNGYSWNHKLLNRVELRTPFLLSGGIDEYFTEQRMQDIHPACIGLDLNSKFEVSPAVKNMEKLQQFIDEKRQQI